MSGSKNRKKKDVEGALERKGFKARVSDHNYFNYYTASGKKTRISTKTSFGHKPKDIQGDLLRSMAKQCKLSVPQFLDFVDCSLSRPDYEQILNTGGFLN